MEVVKAPDPRLRVKTKPVKKITQGLISTLNNMIKLTQKYKDPEGVGLAATQVGLDESFFVARLHDSKKIPPSEKFSSYINPKILSYSKATKTYFEGCLSIPAVWGEVKRHISIKVSFQDVGGNQITKTLKNISAWIFQHEIDHLNGVLFSERILQQKGKFYKFTGKDKTGTDVYEEISL